jgi:CubicO group peptidase (beta-lactamase class C family)
MKYFPPTNGILALLAISAFMRASLEVSTSVADELPKSAPVSTVDYGSMVDELKQTISDELQRGILTGLSVALVDDQQIVLADGFGWADREQGIQATAATVYRVGSISKLFTALAAMQLAESGKLDIDAPLSQILPDFRIVVPFEQAPPITLRQLMCHRSGMVRESPVGGYLDDSQPSILQSVASLESCVLVNPPNTKTRYSNIGVTIVGQSVATVSGFSFEEFQENNLMEPVGMTSSGWRVDGRVRDKLAKGYMRVADGHGGFFHRSAPPFELGTIPAGNLYSSVSDMARFSMMLMAAGATAQRQIVRPETLAQMSTPQLTDSPTGFGLGFFVDRFEKYRTIQHTGAVYGFSTSIVVVPELQIAVVVLANEDIAPGPVDKISEAALGLMLAAKTGQPVPQPPATIEKDLSQLSEFVGTFESPVHWATIELNGDHLIANIAGQPMTLRPIGAHAFEANGRFVHRQLFEFRLNEGGEISGFRVMGQHFGRTCADESAIPAAWHEYLGSYGPEFISLVISKRHGHLYAMTENMIDYRLTPLNTTVFRMPEGLYADEQLVFQVNETGQVYAATLANMTLERRP